MYNDKNRSDRKPFNKAITRGGDNSIQEEILPHTPVQAQPLQIEVTGNFDRAARLFRNLVQKEKVLSLYKDNQSYEKPSEKRRRKKNESIRKVFELEHKEENGFEKKPRRSRPTHEDVIEREE